MNVIQVLNRQGLTCVFVSRILPLLAAASCRCFASRMEKILSMPRLTPTAGTCLPLNMPTRLSYLPSSCFRNSKHPSHGHFLLGLICPCKYLDAKLNFHSISLATKFMQFCSVWTVSIANSFLEYYLPPAAMDPTLAPSRTAS